LSSITRPPRRGWLASQGLGTLYTKPLNFLWNAVDWPLEDRGLLAISAVVPSLPAPACLCSAISSCSGNTSTYGLAPLPGHIGDALVEAAQRRALIATKTAADDHADSAATEKNGE